MHFLVYISEGLLTVAILLELITIIDYKEV